MPLLKVVTVDTALELINTHFKANPGKTENIAVYKSSGRIVAENIYSADPVPHFAKSTMDGYAVIAAETSGASETIPIIMKIAGEVSMGKAPDFKISSGTAAYIPTGGMMPEGADAVVMIEYSEQIGDEIAFSVPAVKGMNVVPVGRDISVGELLFEAGRQIDSADIGVLSASGITDIKVYKKPSAVIISTGDEITASDTVLVPAKIRDINSHTLRAEAEKIGFDVVSAEVVSDDKLLLEKAIREAMTSSDVVFLSGGSSAGNKDFTMEIFDKIGEPGCFVHGIAFNPGKPTILASAGGFPLVGLPGHPVSALMVFKIIGKHLFYLLCNALAPVEPWVEAVLTENIHGSPGRDTYKPVFLLKNSDNNFEATPVGGGSSMITTLSRAYGYIEISRDTEGLSSGIPVRVYRF